MKDGRELWTVSASAFGASLVAVLSSLCCAGPAVLAVLGAGGAVAAAGLAPYRPYLLVGSALLLTLAFWRGYRSFGGCPSESCPPRLGRTLRLVLWIAMTLTIVSAFLPYLIASLASVRGAH